MREVLPQQLQTWLQGKSPPVLLDVREPWEYQTCHIDGSLPIPMGNVAERFHELDPERPTVVICHHGVRSLQVALYLERAGFVEVVNLRGGVAEWARQIDPQMPHY